MVKKIGFSRITGQSLLEIMVAIAVFAMGVVTIAYLLFEGQSVHLDNALSLRARMLAQEGIAVAGSLLARDFEAVPEGVYGINSDYSLAEGGDTEGGFEREITVTGAGENKKVAARVGWQGFGGRERSISIETLFSDWRQRSGAAKELNVHTDAVSSTGASLSGITFGNAGASDIAIEALEVEWNGDSAVSSVMMDGASLFAASTTTVPVGSGGEVDITDFAVPAHSDHAMEIAFTDTVPADLLIVFVLNDSSRRYVHITL
jgi:hypothetical protein